MSGALALLGAVGIFMNLNTTNEPTPIYFALCTPLTFYSIDRLFKRLSEHLVKRDFIAYVRFSDQVNYKWKGKNPHLRTSDKVITYCLLAILLLLFFSILVLTYGL